MVPVLGLRVLARRTSPSCENDKLSTGGQSRHELALWSRACSRSSLAASEFVVLKNLTMEFSKPTTTKFSFEQMAMLLHHCEDGIRYSTVGVDGCDKLTMRN